MASKRALTIGLVVAVAAVAGGLAWLSIDQQPLQATLPEIGPGAVNGSAYVAAKKTAPAPPPDAATCD
jgi:hypothetical protein